LKKAFEGKLVPQDPNDEPAEKLLERIKSEKVQLQAKIKTKKIAGMKKTEFN
jgi:type I restriction enzyme S subunit